jgi:quinol monooxygenase YgiN
VISISRFQVEPASADRFRADAEVAVAQFASSVGCLGAELVRNLDDPRLWTILSRWQQVGDYRRAFNGTPAKLALIPLLSLAIDEPSAYDDPAVLGLNRPRGTVG